MTVSATSGVANMPLAIKQGSDFTVSMTWLDDSGNPMNLTGFTMKLTIRPFVGSPTSLLTLSSANNTGSYIALGGTAGTISLIFVHADTAAFAPIGLPLPGSPITNGLRSYALGAYDLQFTDPTGNIGYLVEGSVSLDPWITQ
jgi:hypothetical protein